MPVVAITTHMKKLSAEDFYKLRFVHDPQVHGGKTVFVVSRPDKKLNDYRVNLWLHDGKLRSFTSGRSDSKPRWSPDGKSIAFVSKRGKEKRSQIMLIPLNGGEAAEVCDFDGDIGAIAWGANGRSIFFLGTTKESKEGDTDVKRITRYPFYFNAKGFLHDRETQVYRTGLSGNIRQVTKGNFTINSFSIVPGSNRLVLSLRMDGWDVSTSDIYTCSADGKGLKNLTNYPSSYSYLSVSPNGKTIAYAYRDKSKGLFKHLKLCLLPVSGGTPTVSEEPDLNIGNTINSDSRVATEATLRWSRDSKRVFFPVTDGANCDIYSLDVKSALLSRELSSVGSIESFDLLEDGFSLVLQSASEPVELYSFRSGKLKRLSNFNRAFTSLNLPQPMHTPFSTFDRRKLDGWILRHGKKESSASVLEIHGGPKTAYGNAFEFEFHLLASNGYDVMYCNPRGSDGYSEEFAMQVRQHFGDGDFKDIMRFVDGCLEFNHGMDSTRIGITGGSYGGFMTNWAIGHTDRFRAAVTQRSISDQISFFGTSDIGPSFNSDQIGGTPWDNLDTYWERSPMKYAANVSTPLLILHSEDDYRCPVEQAYQLYTVLRHHGKKVEMELFPGENHELSRAGKPGHRVRRLSSILGWFQENL